MSNDHVSNGHRPGVQSVIRAMSLIDIMADSPATCSLSEISEQAGLPSSTVHRLLYSLIQVGYVMQDPETNRYGLGNGLIRISHVAVRKHNLIRIARPWLEHLAAHTGETVNLTARFEDSVIQLDHVDAVHMLRVSYPPGERFPLHASASGKVFLAFMPAVEFERYLGEPPASFTPATVVSREQLVGELNRTRSCGYAVDDAERELGVRCVAAPICDGRGVVDAAISISAPTVRVSRQRLHQLAAEVVAIAEEISHGRAEPASAHAAVVEKP